jgi:hypothetical protein
MKGLPPLAFWLALAGAWLLLISGPGVRFGLWEFPAGFQMMRWATYLGFGALAFALIVLLIPGLRRSATRWWLPALLLAAVAVYVPWQALESARQVPPIHDITTDTLDPPEFVALREVRAQYSNPTDYPGEEVASQQRSAYPDLDTRVLNQPFDRAFAHALSTARDMGWEIVAAEPAEGRIEATATTFWYGFRDDVVIRVRTDGEYSLIDLRSVSRVGRSDAGTNARRIRSYLERLDSEPLP